MKVLHLYKFKLRPFVNLVSNNVFSYVKKINKRSRILLYIFEYYGEVIEIHIRIDKKNESIIEGFDIHGETDDNIHINIEINEYFDYNEFQAELRNVLRHEIEHIAQFYELNENIKPRTIECHSHIDIAEYLILPHEIDAFLYGLNYKRKYLKTTIEHEINKTLDNYYKVPQKEKNNIKQIWRQRLIQILPHLE